MSYYVDYLFGRVFTGYRCHCGYDSNSNVNWVYSPDVTSPIYNIMTGKTV